jgi:hypothetical protein
LKNGNFLLEKNILQLQAGNLLVFGNIKFEKLKKLKKREPTLTAQFVKNHFKVFVFNVLLPPMFPRTQMKNVLFPQENVIISIMNIALQIG